MLERLLASQEEMFPI